LECLILAAGQGGKLVHRLGGDVGALRIERIARFARLEEHIRVLRGAAQHRSVRVECPLPMRNDELLVNHLAHGVLGDPLDFRHLVRGAEPVKEVQERNPALQRRCLRDQGEVHRFLHARRTEHGKPRRARQHHVAMVAKDGQRVRRERACGDMEHGGRQFPRDLQHIGDLSSKPWEAVNVQVSAPVWSAPCTAPAAPPSLCISTTEGMVPRGS